MSNETKKKIMGMLGDAGWVEDRSINIGGNVVNSQIGQSISNSTNLIQTQPASDRRDWLEQLQGMAKKLMENLPEDKQGEVAENLEILVKQAISETPNRRWYSIAAVGLLDAAKFVKDLSGDIAGPILKLGKAIWSDYVLPGE